MDDAKSSRDQRLLMVSGRRPASRCCPAVRVLWGFLRASKVGNRMDIEIDFVVGAESAVRTIAGSETVGTDLHEQLATVGCEHSVVVTFTADRRWAA